MRANLIKRSLEITIILCVGLVIIGLLADRAHSKRPAAIHITIRIPSHTGFGYSGFQSILEAYQIESIGRQWNTGRANWTGKYIESMIAQSDPEDTTLANFHLKPGQKIEFGE